MNLTICARMLFMCTRLRLYNFCTYIKCSPCIVHVGLMIRRWPVLYFILQCSLLAHIVCTVHVQTEMGNIRMNVLVCPFVFLFRFVIHSLKWYVRMDGWLAGWMDGIKCVARIPATVFYRRFARNEDRSHSQQQHTINMNIANEPHMHAHT